MIRLCPHEVREAREGTWTSAVDYRIRCACPDPEAWPCGDYVCCCPERRALPVD